MAVAPQHRLEAVPDQRDPVLRSAVEHTVYHEYDWGEIDWHTNRDGLKCWYDHAAFAGPIFSLPVEFHNNSWVVRGVFCSPHCMVKYASVTRNIPQSVYSLISLMMRLVYHQSGHVVPASDVQLLLDPRQGLTLAQWRELPRQHLQQRLVPPELVPFNMAKQMFVSYPDQSHPAIAQLRTITAAFAEPAQPTLVQEHMTLKEFQAAAAATASAAAGPRRKRYAPPDEDQELPADTHFFPLCPEGTARPPSWDGGAAASVPRAPPPGPLVTLPLMDD